MSAKYSFIDKKLKTKYDNYYKVFMVSAIVGLLFYFIFSSKHIILGVTLPVVPRSGIYGMVFGAIALVFLVLQFITKNNDKKLKEEANRILDEQENKVKG